ncbi:hypothetical protein QA639_21380 [Bradyrhizobium pachyrhizi]|uniref:hypothetical protein n=1 Tax=Bradyrhizobium pachyrhizi TaxID=280333 RepID=UPI0024B28181|nr:hypothetical protein [Bradyrhizobium pachyrhizi]WFU52263.1 hypothetical protein QA639_21380 [Bradyrhizobium pachyrhizi]
MPRKKRAFANANSTPRPLSDSDWLSQNFRTCREKAIITPAPDDGRTTLAETRMAVGEAPMTPEQLRGMNQINKAREMWADTHFEAKEPHLRYTPFVGPRFQPQTPGYARRKARFAQR